MSAIKMEVRPEADRKAYKEIGKALTAAAIKGIPPGCCCCESTTEPLLLLHYSLKSGEVLSLSVCKKCSNQVSVFGLLEIVAGRIVGNQSSCYQ